MTNAPLPSSNIAFDHRLSTSSSLPMRTRHLNPVIPVTSSSKALRISIFVYLAPLIPLHHACIRMAFSTRRFCCARIERSSRTRSIIAAWDVTGRTPPRLIFRFLSSLNVGIIFGDYKLVVDDEEDRMRVTRVSKRPSCVSYFGAYLIR